MEPGAAECPHCRVPVRRGLLARLVGWLTVARSSPSGRSADTVVTRRKTIHLADQDAGDLPPDVLKHVAELGIDPETLAESDVRIHHESHASYTYKDDSGVERTYASLDEMPPELRAIFEHLGGGAD
jgi:hypothetical protein